MHFDDVHGRWYVLVLMALRVIEYRSISIPIMKYFL